MKVYTEMFYATLQKQGRHWSARTIQDENDAIGEGTITGLILIIGILSMVNCVALVVSSVVQAVNKQQILMELFKTLIIAGLLSAIGLGSFIFFRKRLSTQAKKKSLWES